jgi:hypothetical protein
VWTQSVMSLLGVQGFAITRIEHTQKKPLQPLRLQRPDAPVTSCVALGDEE